MGSCRRFLVGQGGSKAMLEFILRYAYYQVLSQLSVTKMVLAMGLESRSTIQTTYSMMTSVGAWLRGQNAERYPASWDPKFKRRRIVLERRRAAIFGRSASLSSFSGDNFLTPSSSRYESSHSELASPSSCFRRGGQQSALARQ